MPLAKQVIGIDFIGGLDTKTDEKLLEPPFLTRLENGEFTRGGSVRKRNGYERLSKDIFPGTDTIENGIALGNFDDELLLLTNTELYSRSSNSLSWLQKGRNKHFSVDSRQVVRNDDQQVWPTVATCRNLTAFAWIDTRNSLSTRMTAFDNITGVDYISDEELYDSSGFVLSVNIKERLVFLLGDPSSAELRSASISCAGVPTVPPTSIFDANLAAANATFDVDEAVDPAFDPGTYDIDGAVVAWHTGAGDISVAYMNENGFKGSLPLGFPPEQTVPDSSAVTIVGVDFESAVTTGSLVCISMVKTGVPEHRVVILEPDLTTVVQNVVISTDAAIVPYASHTGIVWNESEDVFEVYIDSTDPSLPIEISKIYKATISPTAGIVAPLALNKIGGTLSAKPFRIDGRTIVFSLFRSTNQYTNFAYDGESGTIYGRWLYQLAMANPPFPLPPTSVARNPLPAVPVNADGARLFPAMEKSRLRSVRGNVFSLLGITQITLDFTHPRPAIEQVERNTLFAGPVAKMYDGDSLVELGFLTYPSNITLAESVGPGAIPNGTYNYQVIYEWTDNQGQVHRSAPSTIETISTTGANNTVTITVPTPIWTDKVAPRDPARVVVYRTVDDGTVFYRLPILPAPPIDPVTGIVDVQDIYTDDQINTGELLYTTGGELFNDAPPASTLILSAKNRVFLADSEDGLVWYSKKFVEGEGVSFNLAQRINPEGTIRAISELDDKVVVFEANRIFVLSGDGPNALGEQDSFTPLQLVTSNVGCIDARSVVEMAEGIMFKSDKGIYLLSRSLDTGYIGAPVEDFNGQTITDGTLVPEVNQVRFLTDQGVTLLYDYFFNQWGTWTNFNGIDSTIFETDYVHLRSDGTVNRETPNQFTDNGASIPLVIETAWIKLAGVQGYQRIYRVIVLGDFLSPHTLLFKMAYDYQGFTDQILEFDTRRSLPQVPYGTGIYGQQTPYGGQNDNVYQFRTKLSHQKCESIKFGFEDVASEGASFILSDLMMQVGVKAGVFKLPGNKVI